MSDEKKCPCQDVINLQAQCKEQEQRLNDGNVQFAVINTKLNLIMAVMGTIGAALIGVVIKLMIG